MVVGLRADDDACRLADVEHRNDDDEDDKRHEEHEPELGQDQPGLAIVVRSHARTFPLNAGSAN